LKKKIKIGIISPRLDLVGGGETLIIKLIEHLSKSKKYDVSFYSPDINHRTINYLTKLKVKVISINIIKNQLGRYNIDIENYNKFIDYNDIYICNHIELSQLRVFPKILYAHETLRLNTDNFDEEPFWSTETFDHNIINGYLSNYQISIKFNMGVAPNFLPDLVLTNSYKTKKDLQKNSILKNIKVLYPGHDNDKTIEKKFIRNQSFNVMFLGAIAFHKRPNFFISLALANKDIMFHMVGSGPEYNSLLINPEINKIPNLTLYGGVSNNELQNLWSKTDCLVNCSINEPFGINILEAASRGIPVITTKDSGVNEILKDGLIYCDLDLAQYSNALEKLKSRDSKKTLVNKSYIKQRKPVMNKFYVEKSNNLKNLSREYTWQNFSIKFEEEITKILKKREKTPQERNKVHLLYKLDKFYQTSEWNDQNWAGKIPVLGRYFSESKTVIKNHFNQILSKGFNIICLEIDLGQDTNRLGKTILTIERMIRIAASEQINLKFSFLIKNINLQYYLYFEKFLKLIQEINYPNIFINNKKIIFFITETASWTKSRQKEYSNVSLYDYNNIKKINNLKDLNKNLKSNKNLIFESFNDFSNDQFIEKII
jgi:glycosyltransferase involved in cell wall biosynthesis